MVIKLILRLSLTAIVLMSSPCLANSVSNEKQQNALYDSVSHDQSEHINESKNKPQNLSDVEIARILVEATSLNGNPKFPEKPIVKWTDDLLVVLQDARGRDLDLTKFPGKEIKTYLDDLSSFIGHPIHITPTSKHDNNVSIVVGVISERYDPSQYELLSKRGLTPDVSRKSKQIVSFPMIL